MGKTNWMRVFLGGLLASVVMFVLGWVTYTIYLFELWNSALAALGHPMKATAVGAVIPIVLTLAIGISAIWLYSAIGPRFGAGPKTAVIAGLAVWIMYILFFALNMAPYGLFPAKMLMIDAITNLARLVVATLIGAWVYREPSQ